jgi:two-component system sensor histidine kinase UhpB
VLVRSEFAANAGASWARLELRAQEDALVLTVTDDGRGLRAGESTSSQGIRGMRERAMLVGGTLEIDSRPERGTVITLTIPR